MRNATRAACAAYAVALLAAGAAGLWRAPLTFDEVVYYEPAIRFFAVRLPHIPLDYPAPQPPLMYLVQAIVYRLSGGSIACVRALATLAAIGSVVLVAQMLRGRPRAAIVVLMIGTFPPMLAYAFSLKQHWMTLIFLLAGYLCWQRARDAAAAMWLVCAMMTSQIAAAFVVALIVRQIITHRRVVPYLAPVAALLALAVWWRGLQPPMYQVIGNGAQPHLLHLYWPQLLLLLFEAGIWIVMMIADRWRRVAACLVLAPVAVYALQWSRIMIVRPDPDPMYYERAAGPMLGLIRAAAGSGLASVVIAATAVSIGCALFLLRRDDDDVAHVQTYAAAYGAVMLPVPFFFESYHALFVLGSWAILGPRMAGSRSRWMLAANIGAIVVGIGYAIFRFRTAS
jgi:hypothetical protein